MHTELELLPVHLREESYSPRGRTISQRVRIVRRVLPGNLPKIHSQGMPSDLIREHLLSTLIHCSNSHFIFHVGQIPKADTSNSLIKTVVFLDNYCSELK